MNVCPGNGVFFRTERWFFDVSFGKGGSFPDKMDCLGSNKAWLGWVGPQILLLKGRIGALPFLQRSRQDLASGIPAVAGNTAQAEWGNPAQPCLRQTVLFFCFPPLLMRASSQRFGWKQKIPRISCGGFPACSVTPTGPMSNIKKQPRIIMSIKR